MEKLLSILICSIEERTEQLKRLVDSLEKQKAELENSDMVEIISLVDNKEISIPEKRNKLIDLSSSEYMCFIDDDDLVSDNYLKLITNALEEKPDCVGIEGRIKWGGKYCLFCHSLEYSGWYTGTDGIFYRTPNHLNPIKSRFVKRVRFDETLVDGGEDRQFSMMISHMLKTEVYIQEPLYYYVPSKWVEGGAQ